MDVIEHVEDPSNLIHEARNSLNKDGKILINVPAFQHLYSKFDRDVGHIKRYTKTTFLEIVKEIPKNKINFFYYDSIGYFMSLISKIIFSLNSSYKGNYKKNFRQKIALWDLLIPLSKVLDRILFKKIGKSLFIIINN